MIVSHLIVSKLHLFLSDYLMHAVLAQISLTSLLASSVET